MPITEPQPPTSTTSAASPPAQTLIRDFFQSAMHIPSGPAPSASATFPAGASASASVTPHLHHTFSVSAPSSDEEEMDTAENRKRSRHQSDNSDSPGDSHRPPGDGSLLTNTSMNPIRRSRLSTDISSPDLTSTPDRVDIQMSSIRGATAAVAPELQTITSEDEDISSHRDHSSASNSRRVNNMISGVVSLTRENANIIPSEGLTWDNQDLSLSPNLQMTSPLPRPLIRSPPAASTFTPPPPLHPASPPPPPPPPASHPASMLSTNEPEFSSLLRRTFNECMDTAYKNFERDMLVSINTLKGRVDENTASISTVNNRVSDIEHDIRTNFLLREEIQTQVSDNSGHLARIDSNLAGINQHGLYHALQVRVAQLEAALQANHSSNNHIPTPNNQTSDLTPDEVVRVRQDLRREDDSYFLSTIQLKGFAAPRNVYRKDRNAARNILKLNLSEDLLVSVKTIKFSQDFSSLRLTFDNPYCAQDASSTLSFASRQIISSGQTPGFTFTMLTPPRFHEQRNFLFNKAREMKAKREITRYGFLVRNDVLCLRLSKQGQRDVIFPYKHPDTPMDTESEPEAVEKCPICLLGYDTGELKAMRCGHLFHLLCIKTNLAKTLACPTCKVLPAVSEEMKQCERCSLDPIPNDSNEPISLILARKCGHIHSSDCQARHLNTLTTVFPLSPASIGPLLQSSHPGCHSCTSDNQHPDLESYFLTPIPFTPGITEFINLADHHQQPPPPSPAPLQRPPPLFPVLTGSNAAPLGSRDRIRRGTNRPRSPPPPAPVRQRTRSRS